MHARQAPYQLNHIPSPRYHHISAYFQSQVGLDILGPWSFPYFWSASWTEFSPRRFVLSKLWGSCLSGSSLVLRAARGSFLCLVTLERSQDPQLRPTIDIHRCGSEIPCLHIESQGRDPEEQPHGKFTTPISPMAQ